MKEEVKIYTDIFPKAVNALILEELCNSCRWRLAFDKGPSDIYVSMLLNKVDKDFGWNMRSYHIRDHFDENVKLNTWAQIVTHHVLEKSKKFINPKITRFNWNYYNKSSTGRFHTDAENPNSHSIIYSLHTTDGGVQIGDSFYKDVEGEAKLFPSNIEHKGVGPKENVLRFNLNIVFEYDAMIK
tara:strand:- start:344 stop:895 length:552 start_codon:yes stop_codon:yes gene_type:complete